MKIDLLKIDKMIEVNELVEVTSPRLFSNKMMFDPLGILSNDIFGISKGDRRGTFAYIDMKRPFLHPHIYGNVLKRLFRNIIYIVSGQRKYSIVDGFLEQDEVNGWTGVQALYDNWDQIDWNKSNSSNERSLRLLASLSREDAFVNKCLVCPPAYRDVMLAGTVDQSDHVNELNEMYIKLIRAVSLLQEGGLFARTQYATQSKVQDTLLEISDYFKGLVSKKTGLIRRYLMGKSVDFGTRAVISAFPYNNETIHENMVDLDHTAVPIAQCCSMFYPFVETWLKNFFTREIIINPNLITFWDSRQNKEVVAQLKEPELQFSEKIIRKLIDDYVFNPDNRFKEITVDAIIPGPTAKEDREAKMVLILQGKKMLGNSLQDLNRPLTVTDILYLACVDVCERRHIMVTRYPVGTDKGLFINKIRVQSTRTHIKVLFNGREYPFYPDINSKIPHDRVGVQFVDTLVFSNSMLDGMGGDFDGDQCSARGLWSNEANIEAESIMNRKMTALNITGSNSRVVSKEIFNSYYGLTKLGTPVKNISDVDKADYLEWEPDSFTRSRIAAMFADHADITVGTKTTRRKSRYNTWDKIVVPADHFFEGQKEWHSSIGRFLFNHYVLNGAGILQATGIIDDVLNKDGLGNVDDKVAQLYMDDIITREQFNKYVDRRDNLGYWLNGMLAHTISIKMSRPLKEIEKKKRELYKQYAKEIDAKNIDAMNKIEKELVDYAREILKDDPGMDLYNSGDLDFANNYKNNAILKGPVKNKITDEFDFIGNSFMNGIEIRDVPAHSNSILTGQYPASIATKDSGYMGKKLLALLQMMEVAEPGTDCKTKNLIPITLTPGKTGSAQALIYSYFEVEGQLQELTKENMNTFMGKTLMFRSPKSCITPKICSICAGNLFYKLDVEQAGLFAVQLSHSALNLALKSKHVQTVNLFHIDPNAVIEDI